MSIDWTTIVVTLITSLASGGLGGFLLARAKANVSIAAAWAQYAKTLEGEISELKKAVAQIPALRATQETMSAEISHLQSENISLKARVNVLSAWNEDYKEWGRILSNQVAELGGVPKPFRRKRSKRE